ncbi:hypothetical protein K457DRAFT_36528 [Linnemannia elongata AG-77]|uniref:Uncharacterized protein n=1 Tax=Linnemannia elongata AG-77 TaxID=1314771 RepID=A0A197JEC8_9FUNG|nr:hypothetical protein K457DRAFT_36528 [Linnemannia elongata AG-77]
MGVLDLVCVATDPDRTKFYGLAYADGYSFDSTKAKYAVLVNTNTRPTDPTQLAWSVVSVLDSSLLAGDPNPANNVDFSCTASAQGVFTLFGRAMSSSPSSKDRMPYGIRYDPNGSMDARFNFTRPGGWMNITISGEYNWSGTFNRRYLGYVNSGTTKVLVHASISDKNDTINFATMNESTNSLTMTAKWAMNASIHGSSLQALWIDNDYLYTYGQGDTWTDPFVLSAFPLTTLGPTTPVSRGYTSNITYSCYNYPTPIVYYVKDTLSLLCGLERSASLPCVLYTVKNPNSGRYVEWPEYFDADVVNMDSFTPMGNSTDFWSYALIKKKGAMYTFGNDNGFRYTRMVNSVSVADPFGVDPNVIMTRIISSISSAPLSTGLIIGIIAGVVFILAGVVFLLVRRGNMHKNKDDNTKTDDARDQFASADDDDKSVTSKTTDDISRRNYSYLEGKYPCSIYRDRQPGSTDILLMAPITPIPEHLLEQLEVLQEQMRQVQAEIRAAQISSQSQPDDSTSISYEGKPTLPSPIIPERDTRSSLENAKRTRPWQLISPAPPTHSGQIKVMHSPSAPAFSILGAQPSSSQDSPEPEVAPQGFAESNESIDVPSAPVAPSTLDYSQNQTKP